MVHPASGSKDDQQSLREALNNAEKILLLLINAREGRPIPGNLWFQKESFMVAQDLPPLQEYLDFEPHLQGPYSETAANILENLQYHGLVDQKRRNIKLTSDGEWVAEAIQSDTEETILKTVNKSKELLNNLSKDELLVYIYYTHPEMTTESMEKEDLEPKRKSVAETLYEKGKVDIDRAAELAGTSVSEFRSRV